MRMLPILRLLVVLLIVLTGALVIVAVVNARALGGAGFYAGLDTLLTRAATVREAARPGYQHEVLASLPVNATAGPVLRLDDRMAEARIIEEPLPTDAYAGLENVFTYEFEQGAELVPAQDQFEAQVRDGMLVVEQPEDGPDRPSHGYYLRNSNPIAIVPDDIGEIVVRARARKGKHLVLAWSRTPEPEKPLRHRVEIPLIADGELHNYFINARTALRRGVDEGPEIQFLAVQPSDVPGDRVEIDFIRFLSTRSKYMRKPRDALYETIAGEMRPVMSMLPRQTLEFTAHVPDREPRLSFGTAVIGHGSRVHFTVEIVSGATTTKVHGSTVDAPGAWHDANYDLLPWAGRDVAVRLSVDGDVGSVGLWSSPCLYGRPVKPFRAIILLEDAERPDHLSIYGYDKPTSPFKEQLLQDSGAVFVRARSQDTKTRPSVPSLMTSLLPSVTGVWGFADMLAPEFLTLAEILRKQGLATGSFVQNSNAGPAAGLHQGFDVSADETVRGRAEVLLEGELLWSWLRRHKDRNFLLYLHIADPHGPYDPPEHDLSYRMVAASHAPLPRDPALDAGWVVAPSRESRVALYDAEIRHNDDVLRRFFARLKDDGLFEDTLFVFTADHGEHLGEHGLWEHKPPGYVQVTGVPLMMLHSQKIPAHMRYTQPVQLIDVMPTILDLARVDARGVAMQGDSLVSLMEGRDGEYWSNRVIASEEVTVRDPVRVWRNQGLRVSGSLFYRDWHFIASRSFWPQRGYWPESLRLKVFNLADDPQELNALMRFAPDAYLRYRYTSALNRLQSISEDAGRRFRNSREQSYEFDPDTLEHLKALGYVQ